MVSDVSLHEQSAGSGTSKQRELANPVRMGEGNPTTTPFSTEESWRYVGMCLPDLPSSRCESAVDCQGQALMGLNTLVSVC